ncbi:hypothetical protein V6N13_106331 [Hibiscus sabdariffa]|uniref:Uncharacterized protein n=1 Tax=Hibiscus sabdariffa TaxID=183260 RepID=A0ABR2F0C6_9ROSI
MRRSSIHDITSVGDGDILTPQGPAIELCCSWKSEPKISRTPPQHPAAAACVGIYGGPTIRQLIYEPPCPYRCPGTYPMLHTSCHRCTIQRTTDD